MDFTGSLHLGNRDRHTREIEICFSIYMQGYGSYGPGIHNGYDYGQDGFSRQTPP
ncbi:hypothetical protein T11_18174 [Trichinella zimbabwensis]|uniref:Uncharacterized protein n=1 Tax=Trichinella zimbabwensis TaxID=268475 RepID=A0A0V1H0C8_9BILA|nr:hypothetical protein T11_18174 [Trichinella zimbabwensis]